MGFSLRRLLGLDSLPETGADDADAIQRIARALEALAPERARYLAAFAFLLGRVAHADLHISDAETGRMQAIVRELGGLPEAQAALVVEIAKSQNRLFGATEGFLVTRQLRASATPEECRHLLDCLCAVSAADGAISSVEERQIRQIASELGLDHADYVAALRAWAQHRALLKPTEGPSGTG
ncbi:MAG: TerB family tellurite resistance protein [Thermoanaerobaculia bacterium]|nr:MAG: TerB family tellurite resistance protein [Thermoanaerobaculia bacterium]